MIMKILIIGIYLFVLSSIKKIFIKIPILLSPSKLKIQKELKLNSRLIDV